MLTTPDVASDKNLAEMTTPPLQRGSIWPRNFHQATGPLDYDMSFIWISILILTVYTQYYMRHINLSNDCLDRCAVTTIVDMIMRLFHIYITLVIC